MIPVAWFVRTWEPAVTDRAKAAAPWLARRGRPCHRRTARHGRPWGPLPRRVHRGDGRHAGHGGARLAGVLVERANDARQWATVRSLGSRHPLGHRSSWKIAVVGWELDGMAATIVWAPRRPDRARDGILPPQLKVPSEATVVVHSTLLARFLAFSPLR